MIVIGISYGRSQCLALIGARRALPKTYNPAACACAPGHIPAPSGLGCIECGENQSAMSGKCVCNAGYTQASDGGVCEKAAIGAECTNDGECNEAFPYCAADGDGHYCSAKVCTATSCPSGFSCESTADPSFCKKLPKGLGASCQSNEDCADGEAKFCDMQMTHTCILAGCANGDVHCPGSYGCCDLGAFVPNLSVCTPPDGLTDGKCAFGTLVKP